MLLTILLTQDETETVVFVPSSEVAGEYRGLLGLGLTESSDVVVVGGEDFSSDFSDDFQGGYTPPIIIPPPPSVPVLPPNPRVGVHRVYLARGMRRVSGPQMRRTYRYPTKLIPGHSLNIYKETVADVYADTDTFSTGP